MKIKTHNMELTEAQHEFTYKIMLVDDDVDDQIMFTEAVADMNCQVHVFNSGLSALLYLKNLTREDHPHVIVLDYEMPAYNGLDVLKRLKLKENFHHIPVIVYSSEMTQSLSETLMQHGAAQCFKKSIHLRDLKEYLQILRVVFRNSDFHSMDVRNN